MKAPESILSPVKRFRGGTELEHNKNTENFETVSMPVSESVCIPLLQHIGAPCEPIVKKGDKVFVGTKIAQSEKAVSAPIHSSCSGEVSDIKDIDINGKAIKCIIIKSDGEMTPDPALKPFKVKSEEDLEKAALECGLVGLGGAGFPTYIKFKAETAVKIDTLIVNAAECEPYITSDYRESLENFNDIIEGVYLIKEIMHLQRVIICVESNKPKAIDKLMLVAADHRDADDTVKLMRLPDKYPQGAEKLIVYSATGRKIPLGKLPSDVGCIVSNITTIGTLYRFITTGIPLVTKRITVDGTAIKEPKNLQVPIGTSIKDIERFISEEEIDADKIILGGPMMGTAIADENAVIEKRTNAVLFMKPKAAKKTTGCIHCGRCAKACPMKLYPASVEAALNAGLHDRLESLNTAYCIECGCCSYVCPASRPLTQAMRTAKAELRRNKK